MHDASLRKCLFLAFSSYSHDSSTYACSFPPLSSIERARYARKLQRLWRGYYARKVRDVKLFDRETMAREQVVAELASEATYALEKWHGLSRAYAKKQFEARIEDLTEKEAALQKVKYV